MTTSDGFEPGAGRTPTGARDGRLAYAALVLGAIGLLLSATPLAWYREPPIWYTWIDGDASEPPQSPDGAGREPKTSLEFKIGKVTVGLNRGKPEPATEEERAAYERELADFDTRRTAIRTFRWSGVAAGLTGMVLGGIAWAHKQYVRVAKVGVAIAALALTWEFVALGIVIAMALTVLSAFS